MKLLVLFSLLIAFVFSQASELKIEVIKAIPEEDCKQKTKVGNIISVHYEGTLEDGTVFDSSYGRNQPIRFALGTGRVIKGWDDGLLDMCVGEKRKLTIPPHLGYGDRGIGPIPPSATLVFLSELVEINENSHDEL